MLSLGALCNVQHARIDNWVSKVKAIHAPVSLTSATLGPGAHFLHVQAKALLFGILLHSSRTDYVPSSSTHFLFAHSFEKYTQRGFTLRV